jgi:RND superfamily putative drug exporter
VTVVAEGPAEELRPYAERLRARPDVVEVRPVEQRGALAVVDIVPRGTSQGDEAQRLVRDLRADRPPARSWVTGEAAILLDFKDEVRRWAPVALAVVALATLVLLFLMTGSVLVPSRLW